MAASCKWTLLCMLQDGKDGGLFFYMQKIIRHRSMYFSITADILMHLLRLIFYKLILSFCKMMF